MQVIFLGAKDSRHNKDILNIYRHQTDNIMHTPQTLFRHKIAVDLQLSLKKNWDRWISVCPNKFYRYIAEDLQLDTKQTTVYKHHTDYRIL
jgi:hypothetical protein